MLDVVMPGPKGPGDDGTNGYGGGGSPDWYSACICCDSCCCTCGPF